MPENCPKGDSIYTPECHQCSNLWDEKCLHNPLNPIPIRDILTLQEQVDYLSHQIKLKVDPLENPAIVTQEEARTLIKEALEVHIMDRHSYQKKKGKY